MNDVKLLNMLSVCSVFVLVIYEYVIDIPEIWDYLLFF
jgi:hypothetical protein